MGDRVLIQVEDGNGSVSPVAYGHWLGKHAEGIITDVIDLMKKRGFPDVEYTFARLVEIMGEYAGPGPTGMGCWNAPLIYDKEGTAKPRRLNAADSHGDNGVFIINCSNWDVEHLGGSQND